MKFRWFSIVIIFVLAVSLLPQAPVAKAAPPTDFDRETPYVPGEVLVVFNEGQTSKAYASQASALAGDVNAQVVSRYNNLALLSFDENADVPALASQISASGKVKYAQPNYLFWLPEADGQLTGSLGSASAGDYVLVTPAGQTVTFTRDELLSMRRYVKSGSRWVKSAAFPNEVTSNMPVAAGFQQINADVVWTEKLASPAVCVVDTGVDGSNKDLSGKITNGYDFVNFDSTPNDDNGHGTHVAGIITAKSNSGSTTPIGVSNGKVVAVKSLHAQGWGTAFEVAAGINFCVDKKGSYNIKVINLSLASKNPSKVIYDALKRARDAGIVIVAAAGNDSSSQLSFPAAWAKKNVKVDGSWVDNEGDSDNLISDATISVAASRQNPNPLPIWIDIDNDDTYADNEWFEGSECAAPFTNYGRTVTLVAPGSDIYSTTPSAYPFYRNYYEGLPASYGYLSGSSMAAAYVSGAAARYWSLYKTTYNVFTNVELKEALVSTGRDLTFAINPWEVGDADFDPSKGYNNDGFGEDPDVIPEFGTVVKAPYCWPRTGEDFTDGFGETYNLNDFSLSSADNPFTAAQDMSEAKYLDLAAAMERMLVLAGARDANSGAPLSGATIRILVDNVQKDSAVVSSSTPWVILVNVPTTHYNSSWQPLTGNVSLQVSKSGYTSSYQTFETTNLEDLGFSVDGESPKPVASGPYNIVSVPPNTFIRVVLDWTHPQYHTSEGDYPFEEVYADMDLYLWLPKDAVNNTTANLSARGVVGPGWLTIDPQGGAGYLPPEFADQTGDTSVLTPLDADKLYDWGRGSIMDPKSVYSAWSGRAWPYAQLDSDGGSPFLASGSAPVDSMTVRMTSSNPYFAGKTYHILVTDYSREYTGASFGGSVNPFAAEYTAEDVAFDPHMDKAGYEEYFTYPVVRVWYKGVLKKMIKLEDYTTDGNGCDQSAGDNDWWYVATMNNLVVTPIADGSNCGNADYTPGPPVDFGILPYPQLP